VNASNAPARLTNSRSPFAILLICCLSLFLVTIDITIVNVSLPAIRRDLHASVSGLQWAVEGYTVVVASFLLVSGALGDRFGRRRMFQVGLAVFTFGSLLCSTAPTAHTLIGARMVQALGGSMLNPVAMSIIVDAFSDPKERARAIGIWGAVFGVSMAIGPLLGGVLVDSLGWRAIFWVNVPVGILAIALTTRFIPESDATPSRRFDPIALALLVAGLLAFMASLINGRHAGWTSGQVVGGFGVSLVCLASLVLWELRRADPLIDPRVFGSRTFSIAALLAVLSFASFGAFLFLNALYLQEARGLSATTAGMLTLPIALGLIVSSPLSGRIVGTGRVRFSVVVSGAGIGGGALLLTSLSNDTSIAVLLVAYGFFGLGLGSIGAPVNTMAVTGMPRARSGVAAAVASTSRQVGASLGVALVGALAGSGIEPGHGASLAAATQPVFGALAAFGVLIIGLGAALPQRDPLPE